MDRVADFLSEKTPRRFLSLCAFVGTLYVFRHLAILVVFFVSFERSLTWCARHVATRAGLTRKKSVLVVLAGIVVVLGGLSWFGIGHSIRTYGVMHETLPAKIATLRENPLIERIEDQIGGTEVIVEKAKHYAGHAVEAATAVGHFLVYVLMGFVLAFVYALEEEEIRHFWSQVDRRSYFGTLARWFGHVADATVVTVQLQFVVAACNTAMTLPVLLILGIPNIGSLMLLIFTSALIPVVGNVVSGTVLALFAFQVKGWFGVGVFAVLTFLLHKIESYYLSPHLTARHVKLPGFLLIVSLIACEHLFGFVGFFLSFPILFVASHIRTDFAEEDAGSVASGIDLSDRTSQIPLHPEDALPVSASGLALDSKRLPFADPIDDKTPVATPSARNSAAKLATKETNQ